LQDGLAASGVFLMTLGIGYGAHQDIGEIIARWRIPRLRTLLSSGEVSPGIPLWDFLDSRFHVSFELSRKILPTVTLGLVGIGILFVAFWMQKRLMRNRAEPISFGAISISLMLVVGMLFSPTIVLGNGYSNYDCTGNVISAYEAAGAHLADIIPPHSKIFWQGTLSSVPLLYLDTPQILPGHINLDYTLRLSGSDDAHLRFGFWTETLAQDWLEQVDYVIVAKRYYAGWLQHALENPSEFTELLSTAPLAPCDSQSYLRVFRHLRP
jgi:hypothetical protein